MACVDCQQGQKCREELFSRAGATVMTARRCRPVSTLTISSSRKLQRQGLPSAPSLLKGDRCPPSLLPSLNHVEECRCEDWKEGADGERWRGEGGRPPVPRQPPPVAGFVSVVSTSSSCVEREDELATKTKTRCDESARDGEMASNVTSVTMAHRLAQLALRDDLDVHHHSGSLVRHAGCPYVSDGVA